MKRILNMSLELDDGRKLNIKNGKGKTMRCRPMDGTIYKVGEEVKTIVGRDGAQAALRVIRKTRKDVFFKILGRVDG